MVFRAILQSWLKNAAQQKVRATVMQAAREQLQAAGEKPPNTPQGDEPRPCHVGVVFALGIEAGGLEDLLDGVVTIKGCQFAVREGGLSGRRVAMVLSGAGAPNAAKAAETLLAGHQPGWLISAGFAGGLSAGLRRGDILVASDLVDRDGKQLPVDLADVPGAQADAPGVRLGRLLSWDRPIRLPREKQSLGQQYGALAVDLESFAVAEACRGKPTRFLAVRVISDELNDELPRDVDHLLAQKTEVARWGAALGAIVNRPASVKDLWKLKENALLASDRLAKFLVGAMRQLPLPHREE